MTVVVRRVGLPSIMFVMMMMMMIMTIMMMVMMMIIIHDNILLARPWTLDHRGTQLVLSWDWSAAIVIDQSLNFLVYNISTSPVVRKKRNNTNIRSNVDGRGHSTDSPAIHKGNPIRFDGNLMLFSSIRNRPEEVYFSRSEAALAYERWKGKQRRTSRDWGAEKSTAFAAQVKG